MDRVAVTDGVLETLQGFGPAERVAGDNRYETAVEISGDYDSNATVYVSSGQDWPDALTGAARAGLGESPVLLTKAGAIPQATWAELERLKPGTVVVLVARSPSPRR